MLQLVITDEKERKRGVLTVIPKTPEVISSNKIREYNVA